MIGNEFRDLCFKRTGIKPEELECPREKSDMTPCVARDGDLAMTENKLCVGCSRLVSGLLDLERMKHQDNKLK